MKFIKRTAVLLSFLLCFALLFSECAFAATVTYQTQTEHESADIAWLRDFIIKETMDLSADPAEKCSLTAKAETPYASSAADFKAEVDNYCELFTLSEYTPRAAYVYLFELMNANSGLFAGQTTDEDVRIYLENVGIAMPETMHADYTVLARALYVAMSTGAFDAFSSEELGRGVAFEKAMVKYLMSLSGLSETEILKWAPEGEIASLDEYVLAASRLTLWANGYDVSVDTPENDIYRLTAVLTLRKMGVNVGTDASFEALKAKYTAALLGRHYGVNVEADKLAEARTEDEEAFYMLQLLGRQSDLVIDDSLTYEEAFVRVAEKTDAFALESGAFYADIYNYEVRLTDLRSSLWVFPVAYLTGQEDAQTVITVNGATIPNNTFTEITINPKTSSQTLEVMVRASKDGTSSVCEYTFTILQGKKAAAAENASGTESSASIISNILASIGTDASVAALMDSIYETLPGSVKNVMSFIAPTFELITGTGAEKNPARDRPAASSDTPASPDVTEAPTEPVETIQTKLQNSYFVHALDKIGSIIDFVIAGIGGVDLNDKYESRTVDHNFITFE